MGARLEGPKLEPEGPRAVMGFPTADQGFSSIQGTPFGLYGIKTVFDACALCSPSSEIGSSPLKGCEGNCGPGGK